MIALKESAVIKVDTKMFGIAPGCFKICLPIFVFSHLTQNVTDCSSSSIMACLITLTEYILSNSILVMIKEK